MPVPTYMCTDLLQVYLTVNRRSLALIQDVVLGSGTLIWSFHYFTDRWIN